MERILVVEDSETQAMRLRHVLENADYEVECAGNARKALEQMDEKLPQLVITDYNLPGISGDELCRRMRMSARTRGVPILILTSEETTDTETRGLQSGADDFVRKSENDDILLIRVQALLRKAKLPEALAEGESGIGPTRILVVDDSDTYREYVEMELQRAGYQVETAADAAGALERLALEDFDAVVLDMILPDMHGPKMCECFVEARRTSDRSFVILMLTGGEKTEEMNAVIAAGADDVVGKSREIDVVKARLASLIRRKLMYEENQRISREFQERELAVTRARAEKEAAEARAALADELARTNAELEVANRELKETQSQLVHSAKMASLGQLVAGIAHEINNPLAFVMSHHATVESVVNELAPRFEADLSEAERKRLSKLRQRLQDMKDGMERIADLVAQFRTFSRKDEGEFKYVKMDECIESALTLLGHKLGDRIAVTRNYGSQNIVPCYPGPLNQVIMNLLSNAIDAIDGEGEITISTARDNNDRFLITVADSGQGIPEAVRERIFDPFFTTKPVGSGTGLGLSISYSIVRQHGGSLEVEREGQGTRFTVSIPLNRESATREAPA